MKHTSLTPAKGAARAVLALALAGSCAFAQQTEATAETPAEDAVLAPVTVSAHGGLAVPYDRTGVSVTVLDTDTLRDKQGIITLSDALTTVPGVYVTPGGGLDQRGNVSYTVVRGMKNDAYTLPVMDGMRLDSASGSNYGLVTSNVLARGNMFDLGAIEMLRGAQGAAYGAGSAAGVLFLETPEGSSDKPTLSLFNEGGSHESYTGNLTAQGKKDKLSYFVSATYDHTNNDLRTATGSIREKHAGRYVNWSEAVRLDYAVNEATKATLTYRRQDAEYGYNIPGQTSNYSFMSNLLTAKLLTKVNARYTTSLMLGYYGKDDNLSSVSTWGAYPAIYNLRDVQAEWRNVYKWNEHHTTTGGLSWNRSMYTYDGGAGRRNDSRSLSNLYGLFAEHTYSPAENWDTTLALRVDESSIFDTLVNARLSSSYRFNKERTRVFGSAGRGYRAPSSFQRSNSSYYYAPYWCTYVGNPDLKTETIYSADLGIEQEIAPDHTVSATLFWSRIEDAILSVPDASYTTYRYENAAGHVTTQGAELALRGTFEHAWDTGYSLSCTLTEPKKEKHQLADTAREVWAADIHTSPVEAFTTGLGLNVVGRRTDWGARKQDSYYTLRWYASYEVNEHLRLHARIENLTNQKFETDGELLNAGISIHGGVTMTF